MQLMYSTAPVDWATKQTNMKQKQKEYLRWTSKLLLYSRSLFKGTVTWQVPLVRYLKLFLKWRRDELRQIDQNIRTLVNKFKALHSRDDGQVISVKKKEKAEDLPASKLAWMHQSEHSRIALKKENKV